MAEGCRIGGGKHSSGIQVSLGGGGGAKRGSKRAHSEIFTDSTEVGVKGANGWREQWGPVQEQGLLGSLVSDIGAVGMSFGKSTGVRSTWIG